MRPATRRSAAVAALGLLLVAPSGARAAFHLAHIERLMTGLDGTTDVQFVEIQMDAGGQHIVTGSKLVAFDAEGDFSHVVLTVPKNVDGGAGKSWLMASQAFEDRTGMAPDFVFDSSGGNGLPARDGMVCWGKPSDQTDPDDMVDCVSYGAYLGPENHHTDAPSPVPPFGHGLDRSSSTHSSAADFDCVDPVTPITNAPDKREITATSPCEGCGNGAVENDEACDDADPSFAPGDACSADCRAFACGVPTSIEAAKPKTADALFVLRAAVSSSNCALEVCDVNDSNTVTSVDALLILRSAVGQVVDLLCPT